MNYNSNTESATTFRGLPWFGLAKKSYVTIGGAGGIGSWLALFLSRAGIKSTIYDFDTVENRNLGGQLYRKNSVGKTKVSALAEVVRDFTDNAHMNTENKVLDLSTPVSAQCFSAFDNMKARKDMFEVWKRKVANLPPEEAYKSIFIDGRLEAEFFQIYCVTPSRIERYQATLFDDEELAETACSVKQTSHVAAMIGSFMTSFYTNHLTNESENMKVREVPFKYEVFLPLVKTYEE